jgi:hypothetical protein
MSHFTRLTFALALGALALPAQVVVGLTVQTTGVVGIADGQTARFNLLNPGVLAPAMGIICSATVSFVDAQGNVLKSGTLSVPPGHSMALDLRSDTDLKLVAGDRTQIRGTILMPPVAAASATASTSCKVIPTLEIFDTVTGRTLVTLGHVTNIPGILTPAPTPQ